MSRAGVEPSVTHVVVGPAEHGVVRHGRLVAEACGSPVIRLDAPGAVDVTGGEVVHVPYTDRLFGEHAEESADAFRAMAEHWVRAGCTVSVTLHDLPSGESELDRRRRSAYRDVASCATGVVVNSLLELQLAEQLDITARSLRCIPLPMERVAVEPSSEAGLTAEVVVLGFLFRPGLRAHHRRAPLWGGPAGSRSGVRRS